MAGILGPSGFECQAAFSKVLGPEPARLRGVAGALMHPKLHGSGGAIIRDSGPSLVGSKRGCRGSAACRMCRDIQVAAALPAIQNDPFHPPLQFKPLIGDVGRFKSETVIALWRAVAAIFVWFWIGIHEEYNNFIRQFR